MSDIRAWTMYQEFAGKLYVGTIYAETFEQAELLAGRINGYIDGEPLDEYCGNCGCLLAGRIKDNEQANTKERGH